MSDENQEGMSNENVELTREFWDEYMEWWEEHKRTAYETFVVEVPTPPESVGDRDEQQKRPRPV